VVLAGVTVAEPESASGVALTLGSMLTDVALALVQVSVAVPPPAMAAGLAVSVTVGGVFATVTVTVTEAVTVPPAPVAVSLYVVVLAGVTVAEPDTGSAVELTLGAIVTEVALVVVHVSVSDWPAVIWLADAVRVAVGGVWGSVGGEDLVPPHAARVSTSNDVKRTARTLRCWRSRYIGEGPRRMRLAIPKLLRTTREQPEA
jgi:hypothetical protein